MTKLIQFLILKLETIILTLIKDQIFTNSNNSFKSQADLKELIGSARKEITELKIC